MQVKRLKDVPVATVTVCLVRAPFVVVLLAIYFWPSAEWLKGVLWGMCYLDLLFSASDTAAAAHPDHAHDAHLGDIGCRIHSRLDDLICGAISVMAAAVVDSWLACNVIFLLLGGLYVRFSSWFWWDKVQAGKEAADIAVGSVTQIVSHCDCRCEMADPVKAPMTGHADTESIVGRDPRGDGDIEDDPTPSRFPTEFAKAVAAMHTQTQHVGGKIDVEV
jgi:hypothetical protein